MARFVRFATGAEAAFQALPPATRRRVADKILEIAAQPDPSKTDDVRLVAPANSHSGLIMAMVLYARFFLLITYRIRRAEDEVWILAIDRIYGG